MSQTYQLVALSKALAPLTHMKGVSGNEALVMREPVVTPAGVLWVPCLSGNAIRHRLVREPGFRWLVERWGLNGRLTLPQLNFGFHGGNLTEGGGRENLRRIADMQRLFPLLRLVGGTIPDQILAGSMLAHRGLLVCEENRSALAATLPAGWTMPAEPLRAAEHFVSAYQYTRGDAGKTAADLVGAEEIERQRGANVDGKSNLMIFSGQSVTRGACFVHGFTLQHVGELELGALLLSLRLWQLDGGTIGGQGARGHGRLQTWLHGCEDADALIDAYKAHVVASKDEAIGWLNDAFASRAPKEKKAKAGAAP